MTHRPAPLIRTLVALSALFTAASLPAQTLFLHYDFNESAGTTAANSGSHGASGNLTMRNNANTATNLSGPDASGVSGLAGDRALDFTSATAMGGTGPVANGTALSGTITSFTLTGWFKTDGTTMIGSSARLWDLGGGNLQLFASGDGTLNLQIGGSVSHLSSANYTATQEWVFYAVTFDGTASTADRVKFYIGGTDTQVSLVNTVSSTVTSTSLSRLQVGNNNNRDRAFDGYLDEMRFYRELSGGTGALTLSDLESVRLAAIPEPSAFAALAGLAVLGLAATRRRHR